MVLKAEEKSALHNGEQMLAIGTLNENLKNVECCLKRFDFITVRSINGWIKMIID